MEYLEILESVGLAGGGGMITLLVQHYLSKDSRKAETRRQKMNELSDNLKLLSEFGKQITHLEIEILELRRKEGENCDKLKRLRDRYSELKTQIEALKTITEDELKELETKLNEIQILLEPKI